MMLIYPVTSLPILAAYLVRKSLNSEAAFYAALVLALILGGVVYRYTLAIAVRIAEANREEIAGILCAGQAPIS